MADSSEDSFSEEFVFYRDREDWKDIVPVPQDEGPHPIVRIAYSDKCKSDFIIFNRERIERICESAGAWCLIQLAVKGRWSFKFFLHIFVAEGSVVDVL